MECLGLLWWIAINMVKVKLYKSSRMELNFKLHKQYISFVIETKSSWKNVLFLLKCYCRGIHFRDGGQSLSL